MITKKPRFWQYVSMGLLAWSIQLGVIAYLLYAMYQTQHDLHLEKEFETHHAGLESLRLSFDIIAKTTFETSINTPHITKLMAKAIQADSQTQAALRGQLHQELNKLYLTLENNNVRQLQFHLPGSISFLRFHRPNKFGDSLQGIRPSVDWVNQTHQSVSGFEEGRIFNGFRHVFPLFDDGNFVGTVELSYSFEAIRQQAKTLYPAHYDLILAKSVVEKTNFVEERSNYSVSSLSPDFYSDNQLEAVVDPLISRELLVTINQKIQKQFKKILLSDTYGVCMTTIDDQDYLVMFNPLQSFDRHKVGYVIAYVLDKEIASIQKNFIAMFLMVILFATVVTSLLTGLVYRLRLNQSLLSALANTDKLTKVANRSYIASQIKYFIGYTSRHQQSLSLIFFDIDYFKKINDNYGHQVGDEALVDLCRIIQKRLRESDILGRWGGEEFIIILPNTPLSQACSVAEELRIIIEKYHFRHGPMSCSFGVVQLEEGEGRESVIARADHFLYEAKKSGRNRVCSKSI